MDNSWLEYRYYRVIYPGLVSNRSQAGKPTGDAIITLTVDYHIPWVLFESRELYQDPLSACHMAQAPVQKLCPKFGKGAWTGSKAMAGTARSHTMRHTDPPNYRGEDQRRSSRGAGAPEGKAAAVTPKGKGRETPGMETLPQLFAAYGKPYPTLHSALALSFADWSSQALSYLFDCDRQHGKATA